MKLRTALTVIGVLVGTAAIVTLVGIGIGFQKSITGQFESVGLAKTIQVYPQRLARAMGPVSGTRPTEAEEVPLDDKAIKEISEIDGVEGVCPVITLRDAKLQIGNYISQASTIGANDDMLKQFNIEFGEEFRETDLRSIIVGSDINKTFYDINTEKSVDKIDLLGEKGRIIVEQTSREGVTSTTKFPVIVVGILEQSYPDYDLSIFVPFELAERLQKASSGEFFALREGEYTSIQVFSESVEKVDSIAEKINEMGFNAMSMEQMLGTISTVFTILTGVLGALGAIALFVAAIGIVNTLVMSIYERFREIGIMKAIGASNSNINKIFLYEAGAIGFMGGVFGVITGYFFGKGLNVIASYFIQTSTSEGFTAFSSLNLFEVPLWLFFGAIIFAILVGIGAGIYPARRAAKLDPIDALRHE
jgi:putative ABC transport system permease protein